MQNVHRHKMDPNRKDKWYAYVMVAPIILGFILLLFLPLCYSAYLSLTDTTMLKPGTFVGLANYVKLFKSDNMFRTVLMNSLEMTVFMVPFHISFALFMAMLLNRKIKCVGFFRTLAFTPVVTSMVVWAIVWKYILAVDYGIVNGLLESLGFERVNFFYSMTLTMPRLITVTILKGYGLNMIIFLSAMKNVPSVYYEAAKIDGANGRQLFFKITLPLISPSIFLGLVTTTIGTLKIFGSVYNITGGGPANRTSVLVYYIYKLAFRQNKLGYASAVSLILFLIVLALTLFQWGMRRRLVYNEI